MRILFVANKLTIKGGMEIVTILKMNALSEVPDTYVACAYTDSGDVSQNQIPLSHKVQTFPLDIQTKEIYGSMPRMLRIFLPKMWRMRKRLAKVISQWKPDIVISVDNFERFVIPTYFGRVGSHHFKTLREFHFASDFRNVRSYKLLQAKLLTWFDQRIMTRLFDKNYLLTEEDLNKNFYNHPHRIGVMPNPVTVKLPESVGPINKRPQRVVTVGRFVDQKNPQDALKAWKLAARQGWTLRMIGEGKLRTNLESLRESYSLRDSVQMPGWSIDVSSELDDARILLLTSRYEGFGLVILEAMAHGVVPVCYSCTYGPRDIITDGVNGFLIEPGDVEGMAARVCQLMDDSTLLQRMSKAAVVRAQDYTMPSIISRWLVEYRNLLR